MEDRKQKFDTLAEEYERHRPRYPAELVRKLAGRLVRREDPHVVDAGAGTGILLETLVPLLGPRARTAAVDVSSDMVDLGRAKFPQVHWSVGPVEPYLEAATEVDLVTAAQAYQWFDRPRFLAAAVKSLRPGGLVAVVQNNRDFAASAFLDAYESLLEELSPGYSRHYRAFDVAAELREVFEPAGGDVDVTTADWTMTLDAEDFTGFAKSSTQFQRGLTAHGEALLDRLTALVDAHTTHGRVAIPYHSELFTAQLPRT
ncbi:hypothetical protein OK074_8216 [Actinobacteria bacterium OK074]|nr:hypothetical protein OK074_8216 [Actinobacteria bacterium OK074]